MSFWTRLFKGAAGENYEEGIRLFNEGHYDRAAALLEEVISDSNSRGSPIAKLGAFYAAEAHAKIGIALFLQGKLDGALKHFETALKENPHYPDLYYYLGVVNHHNEQYEEAIANLERAIELNADYVEAVCYLGIALHDAGYFDRSQEEFDRALTIARRAPNPLSRILVDKLEAGSFDVPVLRELKQVVIGNSEFESCVREGTNAFNRREYPTAVRMFASAAEHKPEYPDLHCKLGISLLENDQPADATVALHRAVELNGEYVDARYYLGVALFSTGDYVGSRIQLERTRELSDDFADVHCQYGVVLMTLGDFREARTALERALDLSPSYAKARYLLGLVEHALGNLDAASVALRESLDMKPDLFAAEMDTGLNAAGRGDWKTALGHFERFVASSPAGEQRADALCQLGAACVEMDEFDRARGYLDEALTLNPDYTEARKQLALVNYRENKLEDAETLIRKTIELHQDYPDLYKILGDILLARGGIEAARLAYEQSLALNPNYSDAVFGKVIALRREGRGKDGDDALREFIALHPSDLVARTLLTVDKMKLPDA